MPNGPTTTLLQSLPNRRPSRCGWRVARLTRAAYKGQEFTQIATELLLTLTSNPTNPAAMMDFSVVEQLKGNLENGMHLQSLALQHEQAFEIAPNRPDKHVDLRILVLAAPIHMGGNTPTEFLLTNSRVSQTTLYIVPGMELPKTLPEHDVIFIAAPGDDDETREFLVDIEKKIQTAAAFKDRPILNHPDRIKGLERDQLWRTLEEVEGLKAPKTARCDRQQLQALSMGAINVGGLLVNRTFPIIVRPVGSHAGKNLEQLSDRTDVAAYLENCPDEDFFVSEFVNYLSADGNFRKCRLICIDGDWRPCHMAIADQWKVWYMNAAMETHDWKRREEAHFMMNFTPEFLAKHKKALNTLAQRVGLDYFGIDCAETTDGELVLFEADNALIVHDMDAVGALAYKKRPMERVYSRFVEMLYDRAKSHDEPKNPS